VLLLSDVAARSNKSPLDRLGIGLSVACAIHCATLPLWIASAALFGLGWLGHERLETLVLALSVGLGATRLTYSYVRQHRQWQCLVMFLVGATGVLVSHDKAPWGMAAGGLLIAGAHWLNERICCSAHTQS